MYVQVMEPLTPRIVIEEHSPVDERPPGTPASTHPHITSRGEEGGGTHPEGEEGGGRTFAKLVRTIQSIKKWAKRAEKPPDARDAFLDRFKVSFLLVTCLLKYTVC